MKKTLRISPAIVVGFAGLFFGSPAYAQTAPMTEDEVWQKNLVDKAFMGTRGAFEVSFLNAITRKRRSRSDL